jgi:hypothetical protein
MTIPGRGGEIMPDIPTPEEMELVAQEAERQREQAQSITSGVIPDLGSAVETAAELIAEPALDVVADAGSGILEDAVEVVGETIGVVLGAILD